MLDILFGLVILLFTAGLPLLFVFVLLAGAFIKIVMEYERGIKFTLGKFSGTMGPGVNILIPVIQTWRRVDTRIKTIDIPRQEAMTADNVPIKLNAVVYFRVESPEKAILNIQDYTYAVAQYGHTALRDVVGSETLDAVLTKREEIADQIKEIVDRETDEWGIDVTAIKIQDVELPDNMKRTMAKQAEAEREKRAVIIKAEGEVIASDNLAKAADTLGRVPGALHLRTLNSLNDLSSDQSNTVVLAIPLEILRAFESVGDAFGKKGK